MISVWTALTLAIWLWRKEIVHYFDFHRATSIRYLTLVVLSLFSDDYKLLAILWKTTLRLGLTNLQLSKRSWFVAAEDLAKNVSGRIPLLILCVRMLDNKNVNCLTLWRARQILALVWIVENKGLNVCAGASTAHLLKCLWLLLTVCDLCLE
jgi:hypothetical protein